MDYHEGKNSILEELKLALTEIPVESTSRLLQMLDQADKIFFVGVGRVLLSLEAFAKRLAHLGYNTHIVGEITEPAITDRDLLIVGSGSGETLFPVAIAKKGRALGAKIVHIGSNRNSSLKEITDLMVRIPARTKCSLPDEIESVQPMSSLFDQALLLYGDILALMIIDRKHFELPELWRFHANLE